MTSAPELRSFISGVILAGGRATRMGGQDKGLLCVGGKSLVQRAIDALRPQVSDLFINANRSLDSYRQLGYPVVSDMLEGYCGPLAGMASAMRIAKTEYLLTTPCDSPFVPADLAVRLYRPLIAAGAQISVADSGGRLEPVFALLDCALLSSMIEYLNSGERKIDRWYAQHPMVTVDFSDRPDTFLNLNTPEDVTAAEAKLAMTSV